MNTSFWNTTIWPCAENTGALAQRSSDTYTVYLLVDQNLGTYYVYLTLADLTLIRRLYHLYMTIFALSQGCGAS